MLKPETVSSDLPLAPEGEVLGVRGADDVGEVREPQRLHGEVLGVRLRRPQPLEHQLQACRWSQIEYE